ncbi:MAG: DUF1549 and DUF1553 domain-containing protein, partial [Planctomycetia bacterium]|nr:DUF1549 and DUF1553 domain-containing protein [Planctomycetia bacterium]
MIRHALAAGLAAGLLWTAAHTAPTAHSAPADEPKTEPKPPANPTGISEQTKKINELIAKGWEREGIKQPAAKATDLEFMRRVFIDLLGRIPTTEEIIDFERERGANKRTKLVQRLLYEKKYTPKGVNGKMLTEVAGLRKVPIDYSAAYAQNFAELWSVWLLTRSGVDPLYREQFQMWLEEQLDTNASYRDFVTGLVTATGKSNENGAVHFVFRHLGDPLAADQRIKKGPTEFPDGKYDNVPITSRVTKMFLGIQTQCTQCHDHPQSKEWLQSDFWGVNVFFRQTEKTGAQTVMAKKAMNQNYVTLTDMPKWNEKGMVLYERRDGQRKASYAVMLKDVAQAEKGEKSTKLLTGAGTQANKTRRQILAEWIVQHDNFEKAFVNRMWGHLFGRGLHTDPSVDDFKSDNVLIHPELLQYLATEFKNYNHDPKKLLEWICTSDAYQLSHVANKAYTDQKYDAFFARMPLKPMSPEVLFDSLAVATRVRARMTDEAYNTLKRDWSARLVRNFGDDEGNELNFNGTVVQALLMMNGRDINGQIRSDKTRGLVADIVNRNTRGG